VVLAATGLPPESLILIRLARNNLACKWFMGSALRVKRGFFFKKKNIHLEFFFFHYLLGFQINHAAEI
jgi:hypothetical protein